MEQSMFPISMDTIPRQAGTDIGRSPAFNAEEKRFLVVDGGLLERTGREAVQQWIDLMLRQQIGKVPIYQVEGTDRIGLDRSMIGSRLPPGLVSAELERNVRETLSFCPAIQAVEDFTVTRRGRAYHVAFKAILYDESTLEVERDV